MDQPGLHNNMQDGPTSAPATSSLHPGFVVESNGLDQATEIHQDALTKNKNSLKNQY